ncbi:MAG: hypothetical protein M1840_007606 [Geoglossum simile]|nr:MAG: hypothetical protein M1840_007606 [Geoglossum simile]
MSVLHGSVTLNGEVNYHIASHEISHLFHIPAGESKIELVLAFKQNRGAETATVRVEPGLRRENRLHLLKMESSIEHRDDQPDPLPMSLTDISLGNAPFVLSITHPTAFRGKKAISVTLTYTWHPAMLVLGPDDIPKSLYVDECGWDKDATELVGKELGVVGRIDFGDIKPDIQMNFCVKTPNEPPYALTFSIVRHPKDPSSGQMQLKRTLSSEERTTPVRRIFTVLSIAGQAIIERHSVPSTQNEGGIYALTEMIELPEYGNFLIDLQLKLHIPVTAIIMIEDVEEGWALDENYLGTPSTSTLSLRSPSLEPILLTSD